MVDDLFESLSKRIKTLDTHPPRIDEITHFLEEFIYHDRGHDRAANLAILFHSSVGGLLSAVSTN